MGGFGIRFGIVSPWFISVAAISQIYYPWTIQFEFRITQPGTGQHVLLIGTTFAYKCSIS